jgi:TonB family protein
MNRLQKKCVIATAGIHLLLLVILIVGPAFFLQREKADDSQVLDVIPANLIDAAFNNGVRGAQPPPPAPPAMAAPQPTPPAPTFMQRIEKAFTPEPVKPTPAENQPHTPKVNLQLVTRNAPKNLATKSQDNSQEKLRAEALKAARALKRNLTSATTVDMPGNSSAAYAPYKDALATIYYNAWITPDDTANDEANTTVKITVASDGTVVNARIITPSGDAKADDSVQRALERVTSVPPLPDKSKAEQDFVISFNLKAKRMLE